MGNPTKPRSAWIFPWGPLFLFLSLACLGTTKANANSQMLEHQQPVVLGGDDEMARSILREEEEIPYPDRPDISGDSDGEKDSAYIFDQSVLREYRLRVSEKNLEYLDNRPTRKVYVKAHLEFEGKKYSSVYLRYKGSWGAFRNCIEGFPSMDGKKTCAKLGMMIKFDKKDKERRFYDLTHLQFHSMNQDRSKVREMLGYQVFREMGIPSSRTSYARIYVNDVFLGLFVNVEHVDRSFIEKHSPLLSTTGNLLKDTWPFDWHGEAVSNKKMLTTHPIFLDDPLQSHMNTFAKNFLTHEKGPSRTEYVSRYMNMTYIMSYIVGDRAVRHNDGPLFFTWSFRHNFYWYEDFTSNQFFIFPWDLDEVLPEPWNPLWDRIREEWGHIDLNCSKILPVLPWAVSGCQKSSACDVLVNSWLPFEDEFLAAGNRLLNGIYASGKAASLINTWSDLISDTMEEVYELYPDDKSTTSPEEWKASRWEVRKDLERRRSYFKFRILGTGDYEPEVHGDGTVLPCDL